jgi:SAM-dependent methyltransferase
MSVGSESSEVIAWHNAWKQVDQTSNPRWFVDHLETLRADKLKLAESDPAQFFSYLDLKEGHRVLEVGCGTGDLLPMLARLVGESGSVVGVDRSSVMIGEAARRARKVGLTIDCRVCDACELDSASNTFDRCFASAVFQHLQNPAKALAEMVRVTRPGGRIVVTEQDWETHIIEADDHDVTRRILNFSCDQICDGWMGRKLPGLFNQLGLTDIVVTPITFVSTDYARTAPSLYLPTLLARAQTAGVITRAEAESWLADLEQRGRSGQFFRALTSFRVYGQKPYPSFC